MALTGLIRNVGTSGDRDNIQLIEDLAVAYISKPNCIILMTITCESTLSCLVSMYSPLNTNIADFANQGAYGLARDYDPQGLRTVGTPSCLSL